MSHKKNLERKGIAYIALSILLAVALFAAWIITGPIVPSVQTMEWIKFASFVFAIALAATGISGIRLIRKVGFSWLTGLLCVVFVAVNGTTLFFASASFITGAPEVKGIVENIGGSYIFIKLDEEYRDEYKTSVFYGPLDGLLAEGTNSLLGARLSKETVFYKQYGKWPWQKKAASISDLRQGQHVQIKHNGLRFLTGSISEAGVVIILYK